MEVSANTLVHSEIWALSQLATYFSVKKWTDAGSQDFLGSSHKKEILASIYFHDVEHAFHFKHDWSHQF